MADQEISKCDFCHQTKIVQRTYLKPSKYVQPESVEERRKLHNEGGYFVTIKTCEDCGIPQFREDKSELSEIDKNNIDFKKLIGVNRDYCIDNDIHILPEKYIFCPSCDKVMYLGISDSSKISGSCSCGTIV